MCEKKKIFLFLVKRAGRHFGFYKRAGRHEKGAERHALQKKRRQNTVLDAEHTYINIMIKYIVLSIFMYSMNFFYFFYYYIKERFNMILLLFFFFFFFFRFCKILYYIYYI